ncbi:GH1 family beta-glucosidase [Formosa sp. S-31]|uniref:GH1 family beta-glucosidase n=1 Tax=Formosa sp. S-31 TaxID=2790949 RepID=UPI003EC05827
MKTIKRSNFPEDFTWGVANSSYQTEGAYNSYGKGPSIWDTFTNRKVFKKGNGNIATDFYHNYKEDIKSAKALHLNAFRFSISWSRIFPDGEGRINREGVTFYHEVIQCCLEHKLDPWITLYHWDLPQKLEDQGGWTNRNIIDWFSSYVDFCTKEFKQVKYWMVLNEPMSFIGLGYFMGIHAPGKKGLKNFLPAAHHATLCQAEGGRIIRKNLPKAIIGTTYSCSYVTPKNRQILNVRAAKRIDSLLNRFFIEPALGLGYPYKAIPGLKRIEKYFMAGDENKMIFNFDFIGVQYYFRVVAEHRIFPLILHAGEIPASKRNVKTNNMGMEVFPKGLYKMLKQFNTYKDVHSIYITESGICLDDEIIHGKIKDKERIKYIKNTLKVTQKALGKGINIKGYFNWTLVDNFEWAEGFSPRFGLIHNDHNTQKRTFKKSAYWLQEYLKR